MIAFEMQGRGQSSQPSCPIADLRQELCSSAAQLASWQQHHNQCCTPPRQRGIRIAKLTIAFLCQPPHPAPNRRTPRQFQSTRHAGTVHGDRRHAVTPSGSLTTYILVHKVPCFKLWCFCIGSSWLRHHDTCRSSETPALPTPLSRPLLTPRRRKSASSRAQGLI